MAKINGLSLSGNAQAARGFPGIELRRIRIQVKGSIVLELSQGLMAIVDRDQ